MKSNGQNRIAPEKSLVERDRKHLWHPLTQHKLQSDLLGITRAEGAMIYDEAGKGYVDAISSWYTCVYGHCHPYILQKVSDQMRQLDQVVFSGLTHEPAVRLSEELIKMLPGNQKKLFFSDNGSTTVEVAVKMALQYHFNRDSPRNVILAFEDGFHGDTFGAMSVSGLSVYNGPFRDFTLEVQRIPTPSTANPSTILAELDQLIEKKRLAAFIYEPLIQGAAAMKMHHAEGLSILLRRLREAGVLLIADEVMTGFGKTGSCFASEQVDEKPDIICLSKALTAGLLPMGITSCTQEIYDAFYSDDIAKGFFHGHTYTANPLSCTAALAALELYRQPGIQDGIDFISKSHLEFASQIVQRPSVADVRCKGVVFAMDLSRQLPRYGAMRDKLYHHFLEKGVYLRPLGNTIYFLPPYIIEPEQLERVYRAAESLLDELDKQS